VPAGTVVTVSTEKLTTADIATRGLDDWRVLQGPLFARYRTGDFATGLRLVDAIGAAADELDHHPDIDLRYGSVQIRLFSHDVGGKTERDVELARRISAAAAELGVTPELEVLTLVEHGIDTWDVEEILPFWLAVYGVPRHPKGAEVIDPANLSPTIWFQETDAHDTPRQRWHPDVWVGADYAQQRIDAAVAAGGTIADGTNAPSFVVLADPQGNRVCICTADDR
jgi:4a-hydroxytetrahydrobiopterin dehydratase